MKKKPIGFYNYTVILTYCGTLCALIGMMLVLKGRFLLSMITLILSGLCDMFDGTVAAKRERTRAEKTFGMQIDSLSDLISFGVFPALFGYVCCGQSFAAGIISIVFVFCGLIRLAYFNVLEDERKWNNDNTEKTFVGVPITTIAIILPAAYFISNSKIINSNILITVILGLSAAGFIFPVTIKKPRKTGKILLVLIGAIIFIAITALIIYREKLI